MEIENFLNRLPEDWNDIDEIAVFGFGRTAVRNIDKLAKEFKIELIVDNDPNIYGKQYNGREIQSFEKARELLPKYKIVVATSSVAYVEISQLLNSIGLKENTDFCRLKDFMAEWYWKNRNQVCLSQTFSSITSRCTFNCKYCNFFMPYFKKAGHYDYDEKDILKDFDEYFKIVDYVASWSIIGGEPLINPRLHCIIDEVYNKYSDKIGYIQVISNGSITPSEELIQTMKRTKTHMRLSDYTHAISYDQKLNDVKKCLEENDIPYDMSVYNSWFDLGACTDTISEYQDNPEQLQKHMRMCATGCHQLNDEKFFFCGQGFARPKLGLCKLQEGDCIELKKCTGTLEDKELMLKYCMGYPINGHISVCGTCYGMGKDNNRVVQVAEQV